MDLASYAALQPGAWRCSHLVHDSPGCPPCWWCPKCKRSGCNNFKIGVPVQCPDDESYPDTEEFKRLMRSFDPGI